MFRVTGALALAAGCTPLGAAEPPTLGAAGAFEAFKADFGKAYDEVERDARFAAFAANYAFIVTENQKGHSYSFAVNEFADMTQEEFAMTRFGLRPREHGAWSGLPHLGTHVRGNGSLPDSVDWRTKGAVQKVKNQAQCGSCWAFSSIGALEGAWEIATGQLLSLSEQQLVDCSKKQGNLGCRGGEMDGAFRYEEGAAVCTEDSYPYKARGGICAAAHCTAGIPKGGVVGFKDVAHRDEDALLDAIAQQPVAVAIEADHMAFQLYSHGVMQGRCGHSLDHGVVAVGYGVDSGNKYWLVRNSWGPNWGEKGYIRLARGVAGAAGECGIQMQPSYPVVSGKAPPTPPTPPSPAPPTPASSHYEAPPCQDDEVAAEVEGGSGALCAPPCRGLFGRCPSDVPEATTAKPRCVLQDSASHKRYCALTCSGDGECPKGASCHSAGIMGVCLYPGTAGKAAFAFSNEDKPEMESTVTQWDLPGSQGIFTVDYGDAESLGPKHMRKAAAELVV